MLDYLFVADTVGIISFALSGFLIGVKERLDLLGVFISAFLTALGGGIFRDIVLDRVPFAFDKLYAVFIVLIIVISGIVFKLHKKPSLEKKNIFVLSDTIGLVAFAIAASIAAYEAKFSFFGVVILALATATGGGVMRDILLNRIPLLLTAEIYGTVAIVVGLLIYLLAFCNLLNFYTIFAVFVAGVSLRLLAYKYDWNLPKIQNG